MVIFWSINFFLPLKLRHLSCNRWPRNQNDESIRSVVGGEHGRPSTRLGAEIWSPIVETWFMINIATSDDAPALSSSTKSWSSRFERLIFSKFGGKRDGLWVWVGGFRFRDYYIVINH